MKHLYIFVVVLVCLIFLGISIFMVHQLSKQKKKEVVVIIPPEPTVPLALPMDSRNRMALLQASQNKNETMDEVTRQYCLKYNLDFLPVKIQGPFMTWMYLFHLLRTEAYEYVVLLLNPDAPLHPDSEKSIQRLIQQSGDSDLIAFRNVTDPSKLSTKMLIFKNTEWSQYKCTQLYSNPKNIQKLLLDQVFTTFKHKTLFEFKNELDSGLPYNLQCLCVYHEKACELNHSNKTIYPWKGVDGYVEIESTLPKKDLRVSNQKIPKIIYQTMNTTLVNNDRKKFSVDQWKQLNPEYKYYYLDAVDRRKFLQKHFDSNVVEAYDSLLPGAYQADLVRYCLLYVYGGCYVDSQTQPYMPLREIISPEDEFVGSNDFKDYALLNFFICSVPQHPALKLVIDRVVSNIKKRKYFKSQLKLTGPIALGMSVNQSLGRPLKQSLRKGLPRKMNMLTFVFDQKSTVFEGKSFLSLYKDTNEFLMHKYHYNKKQLEQNKVISIDDTTGKERYHPANDKKNVFRRSLLPKNKFHLDPYCLKVYQNPFSKIRLGRQEDGGYVVIDIPQVQYDLFLSAGVGLDISFEIDFCKKYPSVDCRLYDGTLDKLPEGQENYPNIQFVKKNIGPQETSSETNWHSLIQEHNNIFIKMDIEGAEFPWFNSLSKSQLSKFAQVVVEFHHPETESHERVLRNLNSTHYLVHIHGCNFEGYVKHKHVLVPLVFECTYLNKKYFSGLPELNETPFPTALDFADKKTVSDLILTGEPFQFN